MFGYSQSNCNLSEFNLDSLISGNAQYRKDLGLAQSNTIDSAKPFLTLSGHLDSVIDGTLALNNTDILVSLSLDKTIKVFD